MRIIRPNCRAQFTAADFDFMGSVLNVLPGTRKPDRILRLVEEEPSMDKMLDDVRIFRALLELRTCLSVSLHFYFYVLVRHVLLKESIRDREVADYVAEVLAEFVLLTRLRSSSPKEPQPLDYLFDMIIALDRLEENERFAMQTHIGNYALFQAGLFPNRLEHRVQRHGSPGFQYYENLGSAHFRMAGSHSLARKLDLVSVYSTLGEAFHITRIALNNLSEKLVFLQTDRAVRDLFREMDLPESPAGTGPAA